MVFQNSSLSDVESDDSSVCSFAPSDSSDASHASQTTTASSAPSELGPADLPPAHIGIDDLQLQFAPQSPALDALMEQFPADFAHSPEGSDDSNAEITFAGWQDLMSYDSAGPHSLSSPAPSSSPEERIWLDDLTRRHSYNQGSLQGRLPSSYAGSVILLGSPAPSITPEERIWLDDLTRRHSYDQGSLQGRLPSSYAGSVIMGDGFYANYFGSSADSEPERGRHWQQALASEYDGSRPGSAVHSDDGSASYW